MGHNDEAYNAMVSNPDPSRLAMASCIYNMFDYLNTSIPLQVSVSAGQFNEYSVQHYFTLVEFTKKIQCIVKYMMMSTKMKTSLNRSRTCFMYMYI